MDKRPLYINGKHATFAELSDLIATSGREEQELRAHRKTIDGKSVIVLFSRPLRQGRFQFFWNWLYINKEREAGKAAVRQVLKGTKEGKSILENISKPGKLGESLKLSSLAGALLEISPGFDDRLWERKIAGKPSEQQKDLNNGLAFVGTLLDSPGFQAWFNPTGEQSISEVCRQHFLAFSNALLRKDVFSPDTEFLREFARQWKSRKEASTEFHILPQLRQFAFPAIDQLVELIDRLPGANGGAPQATPAAPKPSGKPAPAVAAQPSHSDVSDSSDIEEAFNGRHKTLLVRKDCLDAFHGFGLRFNAKNEAFRKSVELNKTLLMEFADEWKKARAENNTVQITRMQGPFPDYQVDLLVDMVNRIPKKKYTKLRNFYRQEADDYHRKLKEAENRALFS
jgi:hypothetical protein